METLIEKNGIPMFQTYYDSPQAVVVQADSDEWLGCRVVPAAIDWQEAEFGRDDRLILDFSEPLVGTVSLRITPCGSYSYDAPLRIRLSFAELPSEITLAGNAFTGTLSRSWIQEEIYTLDEMPCEFTVPRRFSFRYMVMDVLAFSGCRIRLNHISARGVTSADERMLLPPPENIDGELREIDRIGVATLRNCMQTVFEDGPKRDRRLWLGDLRLQMLVNAVTYRNFELVERSLHLLAAAADDQGLIPGCVFDRKSARRGCDTIDYALLFGPTLLDHWESSGRGEIAAELFDLSLKQLDFVRPFFENGNAESCDIEQNPWWVFIDHTQNLDRQAAFTGVLLCSLQAHATLAARLGKNKLARELAQEVAERSAAARLRHWDDGVAVSGKSRQISYASLIWLSLAGVIDAAETRRAVARLKEMEDALKPASPYLWHYWVEMLFRSGMDEEAWDFIRAYWGGMARAGADTFWEIYVPENPQFSPYGDSRLNSACHAWSCTPSYFIRKTRR